jgi:hypothetical protein
MRIHNKNRAKIMRLAPEERGRGSKIKKNVFFAKKTFFLILLPLEVFLFHKQKNASSAN